MHHSTDLRSRLKVAERIIWLHRVHRINWTVKHFSQHHHVEHLSSCMPTSTSRRTCSKMRPDECGTKREQTKRAPFRMVDADPECVQALNSFCRKQQMTVSNVEAMLSRLQSWSSIASDWWKMPTSFLVMPWVDVEHWDDACCDKTQLGGFYRPDEESNVLWTSTDKEFPIRSIVLCRDTRSLSLWESTIYPWSFKSIGATGRSRLVSFLCQQHPECFWRKQTDKMKKSHSKRRVQMTVERWHCPVLYCQEETCWWRNIEWLSLHSAVWKHSQLTRMWQIHHEAIRLLKNKEGNATGDVMFETDGDVKDKVYSNTLPYHLYCEKFCPTNHKWLWSLIPRAGFHNSQYPKCKDRPKNCEKS